MAEKQRSDFSPMELAIQRELAYRRKVPCPKNEVATTLIRSPSFKDWTKNDSASAHKEPISSPEVQYPGEFPRLPSPSPQPLNPVGQIAIKDEPHTTEPSSPKSPTSALNDWVGAGPIIAEKKTHPPPLSTPKPEPPIQATNTFHFQPRPPRQFPKPNSFPTKPHSGLKRKAPENNQQPLFPYPLKKSVDSLLCELCQASCSSARTMRQHLNGRPHKAKLEWVRLKRSSNERRNTKPMCNICGIWCCDKDALAMHFKGQKHKVKLQEVEMCKKNGIGAVDKKPIMCQLCKVSSMNGDLFMMHLKGRRHVAKQEELKRRGMH